nr:copia protein [Tanacetum cinerariifolium]
MSKTIEGQEPKSIHQRFMNDNCEEDDERDKEETYLVAQASNEILFKLATSWRRREIPDVITIQIMTASQARTVCINLQGTKWVFRNKLDENGVVSRNKARLVAQGYNQQKGIDYDETYASVARLESIRILLAYAYALDMKLFQMDIKSAFLNGLINEEVYVAQPPGFIDFEKPDHVYKLKRALYGLKQALKACGWSWNWAVVVAFVAVIG